MSSETDTDDEELPQISQFAQVLIKFPTFYSIFDFLVKFNEFSIFNSNKVVGLYLSDVVFIESGQVWLTMGNFGIKLF